jgi:outer membrane protein OmpA-like peptidoglycan-associated protein/Tol biopolymer transport system component
MRNLPRLLPLLLMFWMLGMQAAYAQTRPKPSDFGIKSKKALDFHQKGIQEAQYRDYGKAVEMYKEAILLEPNFADAYYQMGACYYALHKYKEAYPALTKAKQLIPETPPMLFFYFAESAFREDHFAEAQAAYAQFIAMQPAVPKTILQTAERNKKSADFAANAVKQAITFDPLNLGDSINSDGEEYLPYLTADGQTMFFTSRRLGSTGGFNREFRDYSEDFYYAERNGQGWRMAQNLGEPINTELNEGAASFSPDGQYVIFAACHRKDGYGDCDLYLSKLNGRAWSTPQNLGPIINTPAWESQPCISNDGKTLFFSSSRPGGEGGQDIWYSRLVKGRWTEPKNLGKPVNSPGSELSPFLHADGKTLFFSSDFHPGFGGLDLFTAKYDGSTWSAPINLGYPLNTSAGEGNIFVTTKGDTAYINSSRETGKGRSDIYVFELDPRIRPSFTTYVRGFVTDKGSKKALDATILFVNIATGDTVRAVNTNSATGKYLLTLPLNEDYAAFVDKKGYLFASQFFSLKNIDPATTPYYDVDIALQPLAIGIDVIMSSVFFETNRFNLLTASEAELDHMYSFMRLNSTVKVEIGGHTDNVGPDRDNDVLAENRAQEVKRYLVDKGIAADRISAKGYGERQPIASNDSPEGRALNRRTVCKIVGL